VIDAAIGRTPIVRLVKVVEPGMAEVWMKLEGMNPGGSIKDRTAFGMITDAEQRGVLPPGGSTPRCSASVIIPNAVRS